MNDTQMQETNQQNEIPDNWKFLRHLEFDHGKNGTAKVTVYQTDTPLDRESLNRVLARKGLKLVGT